MSDEANLSLKEKVFLAAVTGYSGAGLEPSIVISNAKDISDQVSINVSGQIILSPRIE